MATDYAPAELVRAGKEADAEIPGSTFSGVKGDERHVYGYHRGRCVLKWGSDYSVKLSIDKLGPDCACSALDMSFTASQMKVVTGRLKKAIETDDPRMHCVREFYGTLDGSTVFGRIHDSETGTWKASSADKSHTWHVHVSFFRKYSSDYKAARGVVDVMKGIAPPSTPKPPHTVSKPDLKVGSKGTRVAILQKGLNRVFPAYSKLRVDSDFGPKTEAVVKEFQHRSGLKVDGIVGPVTRKELAKYGILV